VEKRVGKRKRERKNELAIRKTNVVGRNSGGRLKGLERLFA